jgi:hypothetical protein
MFVERIALYGDKQMNYINTLCGRNPTVLNVKAGNTNFYHCATKDKGVPRSEERPISDGNVGR